MIPILIPKTLEQKKQGLLGYNHPPLDWGMFFTDTPYIHTEGMKFPIDVVLIGFDGIIKEIRTVPPGVKQVGHPSIRDILELGPGQALVLGLNIGKSTAIAHPEGSPPVLLVN
jgi:uncharacterized membrane protein (UPF0127 family)